MQTRVTNLEHFRKVCILDRVRRHGRCVVSADTLRRLFPSHAGAFSRLDVTIFCQERGLEFDYADG